MLTVRTCWTNIGKSLKKQTGALTCFFFSCACLFRITAARREPPPAVESRLARPASAQKPNCKRLGHTPDEATHTVAEVVAQKKRVTLKFTLRLPTHVLIHATRSLYSCCSIGIKVLKLIRLTLPHPRLFGSQYFCK